MGEVYRAEDLNLIQTVALKFLPERFAEDMAAGESYKIDWPIQPERGCVYWRNPFQADNDLHLLPQG